MFKLVNRMKNRKGFTLIELVVVIAILGILALVAIPRFATIREDSEIQAVESTAISVLNAAELYYVNTSNEPGTDPNNLVPDYLREDPDGGGATYSISGSTGTYSVNVGGDFSGSVGGTSPTPITKP